MLSDEEKKAIIAPIIIKLAEERDELLKERQADKEKIKELEEEIEELKEKNKYLPNWVSKKYVSKVKIKAKIEELDIEIQCCEYADDDSEEYKQDIEKEKAILLREKAILQSL